MIGFAVGLLYANAGEWFIHKYVLHGPDAKRPGGTWSFHWLEHHRRVKLAGHRDVAYEKPLSEWNAQTKELAGLGASAVVHAALFPIAPWFSAAVLYSIVNYYVKHKKSHLDPEWARKNLPWHYDHHMGPDQDKNWCVTRPWFDIVMGTRRPYVGTALEARDREVKEKSRARKAAREAAEAATATLPEVHRDAA